MDARIPTMLDNLNIATRNLLDLAIEAYHEGNEPLYERYTEAAYDLMGVSGTIANEHKGETV